MRLKYVITDKNCFALFSDTTGHDEVARGLWGTPVGAGFATMRQAADSKDINIHCFGKSVTLGLESRPQDEEIITSKINDPYI
jgi:hypothetical protein